MPIMREKVSETRFVAVDKLSAVEHAGRWPCHCCLELVPPPAVMYEVMLPLGSGTSVSWEVCGKCAEALVKCLMRSMEAK